MRPPDSSATDHLRRVPQCGKYRTRHRRNGAAIASDHGRCDPRRRHDEDPPDVHRQGAARRRASRSSGRAVPSADRALAARRRSSTLRGEARLRRRVPVRGLRGALHRRRGLPRPLALRATARARAREKECLHASRRCLPGVRAVRRRLPQRCPSTGGDVAGSGRASPPPKHLAAIDTRARSWHGSNTMRMTMRRLVVLLAWALARPSWGDSLALTGSPSPADTFDLDSAFVTGVDQPTDFRWLADGRMVILSKTGTAWVRPAGGGALVSAGTFSVDTASEKGPARRRRRSTVRDQPAPLLLLLRERGGAGAGFRRGSPPRGDAHPVEH